MSIQPSINRLSESAKVLNLATNRFIAALDDVLPEERLKCPACNGSGVARQEYAFGDIHDIACNECLGDGDLSLRDYEATLALNPELLFKACSLEAMVEG